eukprot:GHVN01037306.1.p1 GENE.GHVN01037306.1~~GHVN01037306.1.p1  ORF type:complete len:440 (-),score=63.11 GHVN01037306.1:353-1672(-)
MSVTWKNTIAFIRPAPRVAVCPATQCGTSSASCITPSSLPIPRRTIVKRVHEKSRSRSANRRSRSSGCIIGGKSPTSSPNLRSLQRQDNQDSSLEECEGIHAPSQHKDHISKPQNHNSTAVTQKGRHGRNRSLAETDCHRTIPSPHGGEREVRLKCEAPTVTHLTHQSPHPTSRIEASLYVTRMRMRQYESVSQCSRRLVRNERDHTGQTHSKSRKTGVTQKRHSTHSNKILVLDMDETLIHTAYDLTEYDFTITIQEHVFRVAKRPGLETFLQFCSKNFKEVVLWTAARQSYADLILDEIDPNRTYFTKRLYDRDCHYGAKRLASLDELPSDVIFMDDRPGHFVANLEISEFYPYNPPHEQSRPMFYANQYLASSFRGDPHDKFLEHATRGLERLKRCPDVRESFLRDHSIKIMSFLTEKKGLNFDKWQHIYRSYEDA